MLQCTAAVTGRAVKAEAAGPVGGAGAASKRMDVARVGVPGLRKTVATLEGALTFTEIDEVRRLGGNPWAVSA
jgi:hypothetical protein